MLIFCATAPVLSVTAQVVVADTSTVPDMPETVASPIIVPLDPRAMVSDVGCSMMPVTFISVTVTVEVLLAAPEEAVMVAVPELAPVTLPPEVMGATPVLLLDQKTLLLRVLVLPSL